MSEYFVVDGKKFVPAQQPSSNLAYVKPDWENKYKWNFQLRPVAPDPGIFPVSVSPEAWEQTDFCWFPERWQWFHAELLTMQMYGTYFVNLNTTQKAVIVNVFQKTTQSDRAYNNQNGTDKKNCYVTVDGKPILRGENAKWESLITCGIVRVLEKRRAVGGRNHNIEFGRIDSFYSYAIPPVVTRELLNDPRVQYAKVVNPPSTPGGDPYLTNFHYGEWPVGLPLPVPVLTAGPRWYPMEDLRSI